MSEETREVWSIVGVDCATQEERMGLARAVLQADGALRLERVTLGTAGESAAASVSQWIAGQPRFVIALSAPLGWPRALGEALAHHVAGEPIAPAAEQLFRRDTDRLVHRHLGRQPPDVGADRVARTARAALGLLAEVRAHAGRPIPLAWRQGEDSGAIEVFPAGTLAAHGAPAGAYRAHTPQARKARAALLARLHKQLDPATMRDVRDVMVDDANLFEAAICALAGADFARGQCVPPPDLERAQKEGFIWFRASGQRALFS
jgi:predicted RNase H-like nuclease